MEEKLRILLVYKTLLYDDFRVLNNLLASQVNVDKVIVVYPKNIEEQIFYFKNELKDIVDKLILIHDNFIKMGKYLIVNPVTLIKVFNLYEVNVVGIFDELLSGNIFITSLVCILLPGSRRKLFFYQYENINKNKGLFYNFLKRIIVFFANIVFKYGLVCSKQAEDVVRKSGYKWKLKKVWWGVDIENFKKEILLEEIKNLKQKLGIRENQKVIGYVGRFIEEKGIKDLLEAFRLINLDSVLIFIGDGPEKKYLEEIKDKIDKRIIILPPQSHKNLPKYYKIMDVLVLPSKTTEFWKEQYGKVLIEAMANGISIVGSDSGSIPEVIGDVGSIFPEGDILKLKEAIEYEFTSRTPEKIEQLKERAKLGSIESFVKEIINFLKE
jgi:glycosyltransferase involved in cell wall biosynthesis